VSAAPNARRSRLRALAAATLLAGAAVAQATNGAAAPRPVVSPEVRTAIDRGTAWLVRTQDAHGAWRNAGGYGTSPVAMTSLAGMALLAGGSTPTRGGEWRTLRTTVDWLLQQQDRDSGLFAVRGEDGQPMFGHGFATQFLASVHGMEEDVRQQRRLQHALQRAVRLIEASQSPAGGWYYTPDANDDEGSVTVTQLQALRACRMVGIVVDARTVQRAVDYLRRCQNVDGGVRYRLSVPGESRPAITAASIASLFAAGVYDDQPFVDRAFGYCQQHLKVRVDTTNHHFYAHLYWSEALSQRGGRDFDDYWRAMSAWLLERQSRDGSWDGDGVGPVYGTAIALRILQLPLDLVPR
jgi:hypothetical protein